MRPSSLVVRAPSGTTRKRWHLIGWTSGAKRPQHGGEALLFAWHSNASGTYIERLVPCLGFSRGHEELEREALSRFVALLRANAFVPEPDELNTGEVLVSARSHVDGSNYRRYHARCLRSGGRTLRS